MKCKMCNSVKGKRFCTNVNGEICSLCCGKNRNLIMCDSLCPYFPHEKFEMIKTDGITLTEVGRGKVFKFSESLFIPNIYEYIAINILDLKISVKSSTFVSFNMKFNLKNNIGRQISKDEIYYSDDWKSADTNLFPFLQVYTLGAGEVVNIKFLKSDCNLDYRIDNNHSDTWLPFSFIKNEIIDINDKKKYNLPSDCNFAPVTYGKFFLGKNSTFYADLDLSVDYNLSFDIEYNKTSTVDNKLCIPFGLMFPFKLVNFHNYSYSIVEDLEIKDTSLIQLLLPFDEKKINCFLEPLENNNYLSSPSLINHNFFDIENQFHYDNYCILNHLLYLNNNESSIVNVNFRKIPIFSSIYDSFNKVYDNYYSPLSVSIFNNTSQTKKYLIEVSMYDLSFKYESEVFVESFKCETFNIAPQLIDDKVKGLSSNCEKNINVKVYYKDKLICNKTNLSLVYPNNIFIEKISNNRKDFEIDFRSFLAKWITPNCKEIDKIISDATKNMDMPGNVTNQNIIESQIKNIYDTLSEMKYAIRSVSFAEGQYHTQRINYPKDTYGLKSGNCIDLSLLLASCFEALKLSTYIYLIPGHAFVGVKINDSYFVFIESTVLGKKEYYESCEIAREKYDKYFVDNQPKDDNSFVLDLSIARKSNIFPAN